MLSFEQVQEYLTQVADDLPDEIYSDLSGGVILLPETMESPKSVNGDLFVLGQYHYDPCGLGRYVTIYYGSFCHLFSAMGDNFWRVKLREVLHHELIHHLESKAGDKSLVRQDERDYEEYLDRTRD